MRKKYYQIAIVALFLSGCSGARHVEELMTLKRLSNEQKEITSAVNKQDEQFDKMLEEISTIEWALYKNKDMISSSFGVPILTKKEDKNGQMLDVWVYRYATRYFDTPKVYLYFDDQENLVDTQWVKSP